MPPSIPVRQFIHRMSTYTISSLPRLSREELASLILSSSASANHTTPTPQSTPPSTLAIIDVRDSDHIGGHIKGSTWVPSGSLDYKLPELLRTLQEKETVVFHCALSQQRGPGAALRYLRERDAKSGKGRDGQPDTVQKVFVLEGGFTKWQEKYGEDERLTEAYQKDIWEMGY